MSKATKQVFKVWVILKKGTLVRSGPQYWVVEDAATARRCAYQPGEEAVAATLTLSPPKQKRKGKK